MTISAPLLDKKLNQKTSSGATVVPVKDLVLKVADTTVLTPYDRVYAVLIKLGTEIWRSEGSGVYKDEGPDADPGVIDEPGETIPDDVLKPLQGQDVEVKLVIGGERETQLESAPLLLHIQV
ncbi:hypothetical protein DYL61_07220 [Pseudomonas nabeulensis]|uniref:Uncharacterized protein n=1 Tax=Pseudomonas nabeulensis TaxID=2293833 RepID=A0A4Z0B7N5_9PSED|nr:hypothetical protein [Pseudomonas nabeulensis]TFY94720.1 hypothetical protein DYL61_07220 [Pseudomonas nabeulensis]